MRKTLFLLFLLFSFRLSAQEIYSLDHSISIIQEGKTLSSPFSGGINSAQIQTIDLDGDQIEEWVIWDINSRQLQVYKKQGEIFIHLPELTYFFPEDIAGFLVLADFDQDGKKDLFTSTPLGIKAYKNTSQGGNISWEVAQNFLKIDGSGNIQANNLDTPLIQDLDDDGDLDLVIFNFASGDYLEFYENTSVDRKGNSDVDGFAFPETFWGNIVFCGCGDISFGETCSGIDLRILDMESNRIQHAGGHSILYRDFDGDGISDLVLGRDECDILYYLPNFGSEKEADFQSFSNDLPQYGNLPQFPIFHSAQEIEEELIISLNTNETAPIFGIDFEKSIVKIDRNAEIDFNFLQDQMVDLGENSRPFYSGNKSAGSIFATSNQKVNDRVLSKQSIFELNNGTFQKIDVINPLMDDLNLIDVQNILFNDQQGTHHNFMSGISIENGIPTQLIFELNDSQTEYLPVSIDGYQPNRGDFLQFFAYQSKDYLLVASQNGSLDLYQFDFGNLSASLFEEDFLGFSDNPANRNLSIAVQSKPNPDLFAIDQNGELIKISDFMNSSVRSNILIEIENQNFPTRLGRNTWIAIINPLFEEAPDLILGTRAGGLIYLKSENNVPPGETEFRLKIYPNPSEGPIKIISNLPAKARLINSLGQIMLENIEIPVNQELEIQAGFLPPALYIIQLEVNGSFTTSRKIWIK
ncbi:T9SS type A sorting domain-containing protein [Algoriphagus sp.]|uniref:T9SS type A sorting domain-containing protein n=1 Tax=Algoriphagus sp. TaxID=1872435 RepID=UPI0025DA8E54|nr:T9SS type A sorting domain-containing protein [Algoriphagus sp.]